RLGYNRYIMLIVWKQIDIDGILNIIHRRNCLRRNLCSGTVFTRSAVFEHIDYCCITCGSDRTRHPLLKFAQHINLAVLDCFAGNLEISTMCLDVIRKLEEWLNRKLRVCRQLFDFRQCSDLCLTYDRVSTGTILYIFDRDISVTIELDFFQFEDIRYDFLRDVYASTFSCK